MEKENFCSDFPGDFLPPSPKLPRKTSRILKRISSVTSFDTALLGKTRKRKRRDVDDDTVSVQSLDMTHDSSKQAEHKTKKRSMAKMSSLVNMLSPATSKVGRAFERSFSFKHPNSPQVPASKSITPYKKPKPASRDRRTNKFWSETVGAETSSSISRLDFKRQEAIFELVQGEEDMIEDLTMVDKLYQNSMRKLNLMTNEELDKIFGIVERLIPLHQELLKELKALRNSDGTTDKIGSTMLDWVSNLRQYEEYCANQVFAKGLLDYKKTDPKVQDFLARCQESSFSRKLDLWNFLDLPRSRLVKYPLLLKQVFKYTSDESEDKETLQQVIERVEEIIKDVDVKMGHSKCRHAVDSLEFSYDSQQSPLIDQSSAVLCSGPLKNDRGTKLHLFLFDRIMVVTRQATRNNQLKYQVVKDPIPLQELELTDLSEVEGRKGSFKNKMLRHTSTDKQAFKISFKSGSSQSHVLQARDEHDKRRWINCLQKALDKFGTEELSSSNSSGTNSKSSSTSSLCDPISLSSDEEECVMEASSKHTTV